jgi:hypothetical protein
MRGVRDVVERCVELRLPSVFSREECTNCMKIVRAEILRENRRKARERCQF